MRTFRHLTQSILHDPPNTYGDCQRTCLAMVLGLDPEEVPHFADPRLFPTDDSRAAEREWLRGQGLSYVQIPVWGGWGMSYVMQQLVETAPDTPVIVSGQSPRGEWNHDVVAFGGRLFDPHPDRTGLIGPCINKDAPDEQRWFWLNIIAQLVVPAMAEAA